jgi:hypothetical protein
MTNNYIKRKQFIEAARNLWKPFIELTTAWQKLSSEDNGETSIDYPFTGSFDEWIYFYSEWLNRLDEKFSLQTEGFEPTIMVKDLKAILDKLEDDTHIVIRDEKNDWWLNIESVDLPDEDDGSITLTFNPKDNFDNRQF